MGCDISKDQLQGFPKQDTSSKWKVNKIGGNLKKVDTDKLKGGL